MRTFTCLACDKGIELSSDVVPDELTCEEGECAGIRATSEMD